MGALLEKPKTEKHSEAGAGNGLRYGLSSMQGWRIEMEDSHTALANLQGDLEVSVWGAVLGELTRTYIHTHRKIYFNISLFVSKLILICDKI